MEVDLLKSDSAKRWGAFMLRRHLKRSHCGDDNFTLVCGIVHMEETDSIPNTSSPAEIAVDDPRDDAAVPKKDHRAVIGFVVGILVCAALFVGDISCSDICPNKTAPRPLPIRKTFQTPPTVHRKTLTAQIRKAPKYQAEHQMTKAHTAAAAPRCRVRPPSLTKVLTIRKAAFSHQLICRPTVDVLNRYKECNYDHLWK